MDKREKDFNKYMIVDNYAVVYLENKNNEVYETLVDLDDLQRLINLNASWHLRWDEDSKLYYAKTTKYIKDKDDKRKQAKTLQLHNYILKTSDYTIVDHINHNTLDNRKENLRIISQSNNLRNRKGSNSNNKSGYRNVSWRYNCWVVQLMVDGKNTILGKFDDVHEAGNFAEEMREKYYGEFAGNG